MIGYACPDKASLNATDLADFQPVATLSMLRATFSERRRQKRVLNVRFTSKNTPLSRDRPTPSSLRKRWR